MSTDVCPQCGRTLEVAQQMTRPDRLLVEPSRGGDHLVVRPPSGALYAKKVGPGQGDHVDHAQSCPRRRGKRQRPRTARRARRV